MDFNDIINNLVDYGKSSAYYSTGIGAKVDLGIWENYDYTKNGKLTNYLSLLGNMYASPFYMPVATVLKYIGEGKTSSEMREDWIAYGSNFSKNISNVWTDNPLTSNNDFWENVRVLGTNVLSTLNITAGSAVNAITMASAQALTYVADNADDALSKFESRISEFADNAVDVSTQLADALSAFSNQISDDSVIMSTISKGLNAFANALTPYENGVDETSFGKLMESSWNKNGSNSFISLVNKTGGFVFAETTPLDPGENIANLYGNMLLGVPPVFTNITDPKNRMIANEYLRDARFLTLIPGKAKYHGSNSLLSTKDDQLHATPTPKSMIEYLKKNGFDASSAKADRRYYTFETDYDQYYSYLETMLNALWIKLGLAEEGKNISLYTFFDNPDSTDASLKARYKQGLGFLMNDAQVTESITTTETNFGSQYSSEVNEASNTYQQINFLTGMGTGGSVRKSSEITAKGLGVVSNVASFISETFTNTIQGVKQGSNLITKALRATAGAIEDTRNFLTSADIGASIQAFSTTNGMKIVYPELWSDSNFVHSYSFSFNFTSPYGDPLSIFRYVLVPFCSLLCFAMPRQAADNGYVSPFFLRADMPGLLTCDFGLISSFDWVRGGNENLWTKDGLPRSISGTFTLSDLMPYLAMTKRLSFLSANPSYTSWLDSLAGLHITTVTETNDALNEYWKNLLNKVTGEGSYGMKNKYNTQSQNAHKTFRSTQYTSNLGSKTKSGKGITWARDI